MSQRSKANEDDDYASADEGAAVSASSTSSATAIGQFRLGASQIMIKGELGVGTWAWGEKLGKWGTYVPTRDDPVLQKTFLTALNAGVELFDTAEVYGPYRSEELLGIFEHAENRTAFVATKYLPFPSHLRAQTLSNHLTASLRRLQRTHVDLYQIHGMLPSVRSVETWMAQLAIEFKAGRIKAVGVSNFTHDQLQRAYNALQAAGVPLASHQIEYSLLRRKPELDGMIDLCKKLDVAVIAYSPLAMGRLSGKYGSKNPPPSGRQFGNIDMASLDKIVDAMKAIATRLGKTPAQVALNWVICKGCFPIIGAKNDQQVRCCLMIARAQSDLIPSAARQHRRARLAHERRRHRVARQGIARHAVTAGPVDAIVARVNEREIDKRSRSVCQRCLAQKSKISIE
jgi:aryl-alcohol dehydrogenase-like predicted oxidoreductase